MRHLNAMRTTQAIKACDFTAIRERARASGERRGSQLRLRHCAWNPSKILTQYEATRTHTTNTRTRKGRESGGQLAAKVIVKQRVGFSKDQTVVFLIQQQRERSGSNFPRSLRSDRKGSSDFRSLFSCG